METERIENFIRDVKEIMRDKKYTSNQSKPFYGHVEFHFQNGEYGHLAKRETEK